MHMSEHDVRAFQETLLAWYDKNGRHFPWRETTDPFRILVSEILLQKTDASKACSAYREIIAMCPTLEAMANLDDDRLVVPISKIGLTQRAKLLVGIARQIVTDCDGSVPCNRDKLLQLRGVGRYISNAVMCFAFGKSVAPVDTNVIRVLERVFGITSLRSRPRDDHNMEEYAGSLVNRNNPREHNYALLDFAALVCRARKPLCAQCPMPVCAGPTPTWA